MVVTTDDEQAMHLALRLAERAAAEGEVPVGAVVMIDGRLVGQGFNRPIRAHDPTAHAEIVAMRAAAAQIGNYRLTGADLYVTLEPCLMCTGAIVHARIRRVIFATREPRAGAVVSTMRALDEPHLNHRVDVVEGVLAEQAGALLRQFFAARRGQGRPDEPS